MGKEDTEARKILTGKTLMVQSDAILNLLNRTSFLPFCFYI